MKTLLWLIIIYVVADRLVTLRYVGRSVDITPGMVVLSMLTGAGIVAVLLAAMIGGVTS